MESDIIHFMTCNTIISAFHSFLNGAKSFPKELEANPARIPPQTPPAGGKSVEAGRILSPRQIVSPCRVRFNHLDSARNSFELCPTNTARLATLISKIMVVKIAKALGVPMEDLVK